MDFVFSGVHEAFHLIINGDREVLSVTFLSLFIAVVSTVVAAIVSIPAGYYLATKKFFGRDLVRYIVDTLMALPTVLVGLICYAFISHKGPLGALELLFTPWGIILGDIILVVPMIISLTAATIGAVNPLAVETAVSLGATGSRTVLTILREATPGLAAAVVASFGRVISEVGAAMMLGGNIRGQTRTLTTAIALETGKGEFTTAVALGIILLASALLINIVLHRLKRKGM